MLLRVAAVSVHVNASVVCCRNISRCPLAANILLLWIWPAKEADTMTLRGYKSRKSTRPERVLSMQLPC